MERKLLFNIKDSKPILLSDDIIKSKDELAGELSDILAKNEICEIHTKNDCLVVHSRDINCILISDPALSNTNPTKKKPQITHSDIKNETIKETTKSNKYDDILVITNE